VGPGSAVGQTELEGPDRAQPVTGFQQRLSVEKDPTPGLHRPLRPSFVGPENQMGGRGRMVAPADREGDLLLEPYQPGVAIGR